MNNKQNEEDKWIWGYADDLNNNNQVKNIINSTEYWIANDDNCPPKKPNYLKTNFSEPGRRISETKCYEFIWELSSRYENKSYEDKDKQCLVANLRKKGMYPAIGGHITLPNEYPHMGAIGWKASQGNEWIFKCGSTLISNNFVLTAAHCSSASPRDTSIADVVPEIVRLGHKNLFISFDTVALEDPRIIQIIMHPRYSSPKQYYDIALMKLDIQVKFSESLQPACLWGSADTSKLGNAATFTGWGVVERRGRDTPAELQVISLDIIDSDKCDEYLTPYCNRNWCGFKEHQICAGVLAGGVDACQGDSGGPLQVKIPLPVTTEGGMHYVIGVASFGVDCALPNLPGVYTRVSSFIDWIEEIVWP